jgi:predicted outer membrane lipoprotein
MSRRRRRPSKPIIPGLRWLLLLLLLLACTFGIYGALSHWTILERTPPAPAAP